MQPVLFRIPLHWLNPEWSDLPIYGYGLMLFAAFLGCSWLSRRLCRREGIDDALIPDLAICLFVTGILGGRLVYVIQYWHENHFNEDFWRIIKLWDGGLVLYGALFGGAIGYFGYYWFVLRKHGITHWQMFDIIAPSVALGVALGRIGCLCTGCCYGNVACGIQPEIHFPVPSAGWNKMTTQAFQTPFGFILKERSLEVLAVEPGSAAENAGLREGDIIVGINDVGIQSQNDLGKINGPVTLTVFRNHQPTALPTFTPTSIGLHPTQIYETISMCLLLFFLLSYYPFRRHDGEMLVLLMLCYGVHRFLNEMLRTDTDPVAFGLTLSQNISILILIAGVLLGIAVWRRPARGERQQVPPRTESEMIACSLGSS
jgi:phosphatidylglycerol---prolipoprotein diacylglyceryl transferase